MPIANLRRMAFNASFRSRGVLVTYQCPSGTIEGLRALAGSSRMSQEADNGAQLQSRHRNFRFLAEDLTFDGVKRFPRSGDIITEEDGTQFVVVPTDGNQPAEWADPYRQTVRVSVQQKTG